MYYEREIYKLEQKIKELKAKQELRPVWKPEIEESYYVADVGAVSEYRWGDDEVDQHYLNTGTLFKTEEEADNYTRSLELIELIRRERFRVQGTWRPSEGDVTFNLYSDRLDNTIGTTYRKWVAPTNVFGSWRHENSLKAVIKKHEAGLKWYFNEYLPSVN